MLATGRPQAAGDSQWSIDWQAPGDWQGCAVEAAVEEIANTVIRVFPSQFASQLHAATPNSPMFEGPRPTATENTAE